MNGVKMESCGKDQCLMDFGEWTGEMDSGELDCGQMINGNGSRKRFVGEK